MSCIVQSDKRSSSLLEPKVDDAYTIMGF